MNNIFDLSDSKVNEIVLHRSGVYQILCFKGDSPCPINRLVGTDNLGILSIGSSLNLKNRLKDFIYAIGVGSGHSSGNRFYRYELKKMLGKIKLKFVFKYAKDYEKEESKLLIGYSDVFGELPPLNHRDAKYDHEGLKPIKYPDGFIW